MATLALIDDDRLALTSLGALFELETGHEILTFQDPVEALEELTTKPVDVVISDYLMPKMTGIELLGHLRKQQPETLRILLTGFADKENAIRAINEVGLYQYLEKPWDNQQLLLLVENGLKEKSLRRQLAEKVRALDRMAGEYRELETRHTLLQRDLEMAARVQQSLLPAAFPSFEGVHIDSLYQPCTALAGDYFDYALGDGSMVILLSDVSGHGVQAALSSMLLKAIFQDTAPDAASALDLLHLMNRRLARFLPEGMFVAAGVARIDSGTSHVQFANAGLPYPFLVGGGRVEEILTGGVPLGLFTDRELLDFGVEDIPLERGDILLLASDGLGDVPGPGREYFADKQLRQELEKLAGEEARVLLREIRQKAVSFHGGETLPDDLSAIALGRI
ncbi:MAG: SpoIIE family protein phosphatase [Bryobacterales bacterium]|jgi:serine phosphatase RsbU (regulator of sigma subunit)|nr:SpoIIE family protein phosphatase [Bryobacterales bacterium]